MCRYSQGEANKMMGQDKDDAKKFKDKFYNRQTNKVCHYCKLTEDEIKQFVLLPKEFTAVDKKLTSQIVVVAAKEVLNWKLTAETLASHTLMIIVFWRVIFVITLNPIYSPKTNLNKLANYLAKLLVKN